MKSLRPLVSIIIPCFNAERWISSAIESALEQTYADIQVIVVNDGSTDSSAKLIHKFQERIECISQLNRGPGAARNRGMDLARGEWIQFLDADDLLHPEKVAFSLNCLGNFPEADFIWAPNVRVGADFTLKDALRSSWAKGGISPGMDTDILDAPYAPSASLLRRRFLDRIGPWREDIRRWVDLEYHARIARHGRSYVRIEAPLYFYRQHHQGQISEANRNHSQMEDAKRALFLARETLEGSDIPTKRWGPYLFPFYVLLSRSAAYRGNYGDFRSYILEASSLKWSRSFYIKAFAAVTAARFLGPHRTARLIDLALEGGTLIRLFGRCARA